MLGEARNEKLSTGACHPPPTPRFQFGGSLQNLFPDISTIFRHGQHNFGSSTNLRSSQFVKKNSWRKWSQSFSLKKSSAFVLLSPSSPQSSSCYCMIPRHIPHGTQGKFAKHSSYRHQSLGDNATTSGEAQFRWLRKSLSEGAGVTQNRSVEARYLHCGMHNKQGGINRRPWEIIPPAYKNKPARASRKIEIQSLARMNVPKKFFLKFPNFWRRTAKKWLEHKFEQDILWREFDMNYFCTFKILRRKCTISSGK